MRFSVENFVENLRCLSVAFDLFLGDGWLCLGYFGLKLFDETVDKLINSFHHLIGILDVFQSLSHDLCRILFENSFEVITHYFTCLIGILMHQLR
jgi:hypothetical protein